MPILLARRLRVDVTLDLTLATGWTQVKKITDFDSNITPNLEDASAYDTNGVNAVEPTMQDGTPTFTFLSNLVSSVRDPGQQLLLNAEGLFSTASRVGLRWYDVNGLAGQDNGSAVVIPAFKRAQSGYKNLEAITCTCRITDGVLNLGIANPIAGATVPIISSVTPSGAGAAAAIAIIGQNFTGVTGATHVTIGGVNATSYTVQSDSLITAVMPAGSAGSAPVIVTNVAGASAAFPYTRT